MKGYKTSRNYEWLKELLDAGYVIPVVWYEPIHNHNFLRCHAAHKNDRYYYLGILTWAESYIKGAGWDFAPYCEAHDIEFIEPQIESNLE